MAYTQTINHL